MEKVGQIENLEWKSSQREKLVLLIEKEFNVIKTTKYIAYTFLHICKKWRFSTKKTISLNRTVVFIFCKQQDFVSSLHFQICVFMDSEPIRTLLYFIILILLIIFPEKKSERKFVAFDRTLHHFVFTGYFNNFFNFLRIHFKSSSKLKEETSKLFRLLNQLKIQSDCIYKFINLNLEFKTF